MLQERLKKIVDSLKLFVNISVYSYDKTSCYFFSSIIIGRIESLSPGITLYSLISTEDI